MHHQRVTEARPVSTLTGLACLYYVLDGTVDRRAVSPTKQLWIPEAADWAPLCTGCWFFFCNVNARCFFPSRFQYTMNAAAMTNSMDPNNVNTDCSIPVSLIRFSFYML